MKTLTFKLIDLSQDDKDFILGLQKKRSVAYRKVYNNMELMQDKEFKDEITKNYVFSGKGYEYLVKEVIAKYDANHSTLNNKLKRIDELRDDLKSKVISKRDKQKLQRDLSNLLKQVSSNTVTFGSKSNLRKVTKYSRLYKQTNDSKYLDLYNKYKQIYREGRILPLVFHGNAKTGGSRFFDFSCISKNEIIFKYENLKKKVNLKINVNKGYKTLIEELQKLCISKSIPVTVKLTTEEIQLTFEEGIITGKYFDKGKFYNKISHITDKKYRKVLIAQAHREHEKKIFTDKLPNRYCGIDLNPTGIGYCIADRQSEDPNGDFKIIKKDFIDLSELSHKRVSSNKRKFEISVAISKLFKLLEHYKVCNFVVEDLSGIHNVKSSREGNRLIKNIWNRNYVDNLFTKWCNEYGMKRIDVIPAYSSLIGNIIYKEYDPVSASIEVCRRGMIKYIKGGVLIPAFHKGVITDVALAIGRDYNELANVDSWKSLALYLSTTKLSVRRVKLNEFNYEIRQQEGTIKSKVRVLGFH